MPGFEVVEARMPKCGIRGTATARLAFHDMFVPRKTSSARSARGCGCALTVLDFGRTTFGASCTGAAKFCLRTAVEHAERSACSSASTLARVRAGQEEDRRMAAATRSPWKRHLSHRRADRQRGRGLHARNGDAQGLRQRRPVEDRQRHAADLRRRGLLHRPAVRADDARRADQPDRRRGQRRAAVLHRHGRTAAASARNWRPCSNIRGRPSSSGGRAPAVPVRTASLQPAAANSRGRSPASPAPAVRASIRYREAILDQQFVQARLGDIATELFHASCVYSRLTSLLSDQAVEETARQRELQTGLFYLRLPSGATRTSRG